MMAPRYSTNLWIWSCANSKGVWSTEQLCYNTQTNLWGDSFSKLSNQHCLTDRYSSMLCGVTTVISLFNLKLLENNMLLNCRIKLVYPNLKFTHILLSLVWLYQTPCHKNFIVLWSRETFFSTFHFKHNML